MDSGTEICKHLAAAGNTVVAADLSSRTERVDAFRKDVAGLDIHFAPGDVGDFDACAELVKKVEAEHGAIDILVNAAGITRDGTLRKMERSSWDDVLRINLDGVFNMCRNAVDGMLTRWPRTHHQHQLGQRSDRPVRADQLFGGEEAGMHGFTMAMAREVARKGVTVNSISPGYCETALVMAVPEDVRNKIIDFGTGWSPGQAFGDRAYGDVPGC